MQFNYWDLGSLHAGAVVEIELTGTEANVRLMDSANYSSYKSGLRHRYYGGHYRQSPVRIRVPSAGHWFVAIDYGGFAGRGTASVRVLSGMAR